MTDPNDLNKQSEVSSDLETEYQALLKSLFGEIHRKFDDGVLSHDEASNLSDMVRQRLDIDGSFLTAEYREFRDEEEIDRAYDRGRDVGWSPSSWCA